MNQSEFGKNGPALRGQILSAPNSPSSPDPMSIIFGPESTSWTKSPYLPDPLVDFGTGVERIVDFPSQMSFHARNRWREFSIGYVSNHPEVDITAGVSLPACIRAIDQRTLSAGVIFRGSTERGAGTRRLEEYAPQFIMYRGVLPWRVVLLVSYRSRGQDSCIFQILQLSPQRTDRLTKHAGQAADVVALSRMKEEVRKNLDPKFRREQAL
jgi:hypothetical protein